MNNSAPLIHPTAVIDPAAVLAADVRVGAFTLIGAEVEIGAGTVVGPHCSIHGPTRIGRENHFIGHAAIGGEPQDKKFGGERTELVIGDRNVIREFVTINRGTGGGGGITTVGNDNWLLAYVHVAHDCHVGNHCVFSNNTTLAGHVTVGNWVIISGFAGAHQFCRIGDHAFLGMGAWWAATYRPSPWSAPTPTAVPAASTAKASSAAASMPSVSPRSSVPTAPCTWRGCHWPKPSSSWPSRPVTMPT